MDAVAKGYLKNMYFGIATDATATNLLEVSSPQAQASCGWRQKPPMLLPPMRHAHRTGAQRCVQLLHATSIR